MLGKWFGTYRAVPLLAILPAIVVFCSGDFEVKFWPGAILMIAYVLSAGAAITSLGLAVATRYSRLGPAVATTVSVYVLITVGWLFVTSFVLITGERGQAMASPFFFAGILTIHRSAFPEFSSFYGWGVYWVVVSASAAALLLVITLVIFDRCLGRAEAKGPGLGYTWWSRLGRIAVATTFGVAIVFLVAAVAAGGHPDLAGTSVAILVSTAISACHLLAQADGFRSELSRSRPIATQSNEHVTVMPGASVAIHQVNT